MRNFARSAAAGLTQNGRNTQMIAEDDLPSERRAYLLGGCQTSPVLMVPLRGPPHPLWFRRGCQFRLFLQISNCRAGGDACRNIPNRNHDFRTPTSGPTALCINRSCLSRVAIKCRRSCSGFDEHSAGPRSRLCRCSTGLRRVAEAVMRQSASWNDGELFSC